MHTMLNVITIFTQKNAESNNFWNAVVLRFLQRGALFVHVGIIQEHHNSCTTEFCDIFIFYVFMLTIVFCF